MQRILILHHWDTDGLASAALILQREPEAEIMTPSIGNYFLTTKELKRIARGEYRKIYCLDWNLPEKEKEKLKKLTKKFIFIDHHGEKAKKYQSNTLLLTKYLHVRSDFFVALGLVGDKEEKAKKGVKNFSRLWRLKELIDSNYILNKRENIKETIKLLADNKIKKLEKFRKNLKIIEQEVKRNSRQKPIKFGKIYFFLIKSKYFLISKITRQLSKKYPDKLIICWQKDRLYLRRDKLNINLLDLVDFFRSLGYNVGGKEEVLGIILQ